MLSSKLPRLERRQHGYGSWYLCEWRKPHHGQSKRDPTDLHHDNLLTVTY